MLLDEIILKRQRLLFVIHQNIVERACDADKSAGFGFGKAFVAEIVAHAGAQVFRFANINDGALGVLIKVDAGVSGQQGNSFAQIHLLLVSRVGEDTRFVLAVSDKMESDFVFHMTTRTFGFANHRQLLRHFAKHGESIGARTPKEYEALADKFLGGVMAATVKQCVRKKGDCVRYCESTENYGVLNATKVIRTFFKPVPCAQVPATLRLAVRQSGGCHPLATNLLYFEEECTKW